MEYYKRIREIRIKNNETQQQLADILRPTSFDDIVGQDHLFGPRGAVRRMLENGRITNMIFYGPPGTGKTTAASIIAANSDMMFHRLNATTASLSDVKDIISQMLMKVNVNY